MAENKIFAGPRVRRIRNGLQLTQTAMAEALGISPSYLNLIERNQRPLTVQLLLKLASVYKVDLEELQGEAGSGLAQLREVFADPLLAGELPGIRSWWRSPKRRRTSPVASSNFIAPTANRRRG